MLLICADYLIDSLNAARQKVLQYAEALIEIDYRTEDVIKPLYYYYKGFSLGDLGEACLKACDSSRKLILNLEIINKISTKINDKFVADAIILFGLHEAYHISQGVKEYEDVIKLKSIIGSSKMSQFDLQSDFIAAHTISLIRCLEKVDTYREDIYIEHFYKLWCQVGLASLSTFSYGKNKAKQQRLFGFMIMANFIQSSYLYSQSLSFESELWPEWTNSLDQLVIFGKNGHIWLPPVAVNSELMKNILSAISAENSIEALFLVGELLSTLPKVKVNLPITQYR